MRNPLIDPQPGDVIEVSILQVWIVKERTDESVVFDADDPWGTKECQLPLDAWKTALEKTKTARVISRSNDANQK